MSVPFGKYLLQRKLAEGGMAEIFLASQAGPADFAKVVVVKRLRPQLSAEDNFVRMFINEARLASRLSHPNIVQIYDLGIENRAHYLAMEYIHGEDLRGVAEQADLVGKRPPLGLICRIVADLLAGLHYAHTRTTPDGRLLGLVHRDISPQNILVTYDGEVKIIDFGIAKATQVREGEQTQAGLLKGKYAYMSPEQTRGAPLDARSDIFSAGILLWELLTWRRLFKRGTDLATLVAVSDEPAPAMSLLNPEVPRELDALALRALAVEPEGRYATAKEFQAALEECIAQQGWAADRRALGHYMRDLFRDKLEQQEREALASGARNLEEFLLTSAGDGKIDAAVPARNTGPQRNQSGRRELPLLTMPLQTLDPSQRPPSLAAAAYSQTPTPMPSPGAQLGPSLAHGEAAHAPRPVGPSVSGRSSSMPPRRPTQPSPIQTTPMPIQIAASPIQTTPMPVQAAPPSVPGITPAGANSGPTSVGPQPVAPPQKTAPLSVPAPRRRAGIAVAIGLLIGIVAVLLLHFFVLSGGP